ncbi:MAG TPA: serine/threonine-protein kinase, partial [Steroidobacteraceae bacterium]
MGLQTERALFEACLELPESERESWLTAHCDDPALRDRVRRLLRAHESAERSDALKPPRELETLTHIGPYRLLERIGEGAMGEVYLAEQTHPVQRRVALKVIKPGMDSREVIARFELERQTLALMSHPSITHILDAGTTESGRPYFAMEYVPGIALTKYCDQHRLTIDERLQLFLQICDAVQHAHQKGVIHRDLKPGNLLVTELNGRPLPKVIDFGIAKATAFEHQPSRAHTRIGHLIGTPEYMSPEQAQLSPLDVDTRADVYSLGVVLHELLTGVLPFQNSGRDATPAMLVQELMTHDPAAPSTRVRTGPEESAANRSTTPRQLAARLTGDLDWIVLKALEKDRNRRYGSPSELAADIRRHLANEPVLAGPPSTVYRMRKFASRHRLALSLAAGAFIAAIAFGSVMAWQAHQLTIQRDQARFHAQRAEASSEFMSLMLEEVGHGDRTLSPVELIDRGVELLHRQYGEDPRFVARMLVQISRRYMDVGSTEKQGQVLARASAIARDLNDNELLAVVECTFVRSELDANRYDEAVHHMEVARVALSHLEDVPLATQIDCLRAEADLAEMAHTDDDGIPHLVRARQLLERAGSTHGLQYNAVLTDLGGRYYRAGRFRETLEINQQSIEMLERTGRGGTMGRHTLSINRASILYRLGEVQNAYAEVVDALRRLGSLREEQPAAPASGLVHALVLNRLERTKEAMDVLAVARGHARALGNSYLIPLGDYYLARSLMLVGQLDAAETHLEAARQEWLVNETANRDLLADLTATAADLALRRGDIARARELIGESLQRFGWPTENRPIGLNAALILAARIALASGEPTQARSFAAHALRMAEA